MNRRDLLRRFILSLLAVVFGPSVWELADMDEIDALVEDVCNQCPDAMEYRIRGYFQLQFHRPLDHMEIYL